MKLPTANYRFLMSLCCFVVFKTHSGFTEAWQLLLVAKSDSTRARWFASEATITNEIRKRSMPTVDGESPFLYFDGATMMPFRYPTKNVETVYCRRDPSPASCKAGHGFDAERQNIPTTLLEVKPNSNTNGLGVFAKRDIPEHSYTGLEKLVHSLYMAPATYKLALRSDRFPANVVKKYVHAYGSPTTAVNVRALSRPKYPSLCLCLVFLTFCIHCIPQGDILEVSSEASIHCFVNQGCKGTSNVGRPLNVAETDLLLGKESVHSPILARQVHFYGRGVPLRKIGQGEEILENVLGRYGNGPEWWRDRVASTQHQCALSE
jgi:hypothetical protein